jgi:hypothetical protein
MIKGAPLYALQKFVSSGKTLDPSFENREPYTDIEMEEFKKIMQKNISRVIVR